MFFQSQSYPTENKPDFSGFQKKPKVLKKPEFRNLASKNKLATLLHKK